MHKVIISTESCADIYRSEMQERDIRCIIMNYIVADELKGVVFDDETEYYDFYKTLKEGVLPTTSRINQFEFEEHFKELLKEECDVIHFSLSSGLSGTADSAQLAAQQVNKQGARGKVYVIDTLAATQGMAKLVELAADMRDKGELAKDIVMYIEHMKNHLHHWIIVGDLNHLRRGGRISGATAVVGSILNIRPILTINRQGKLEIITKVAGNQKAITTVVKMADKYGEQLSKQKVYLAETDNPDFIQLTAQALTDQFGCQIKRRFIGPVVGSHTGGSAAGVVFFGKERLK